MGLADWPRAAYRNVRAFASNAYAYVTDFALDDVLPPSIRDTLNWIFSIIPKAFGVRNTTPKSQINANLILIIFTLISAIGTLGTTLIVLALWVPLLLIGIWRWLPAFNELWTDFREWLPVASDYDLPFWRTE